jgi:hypothetical protein
VIGGFQSSWLILWPIFGPSHKINKKIIDDILSTIKSQTWKRIGFIIVVVTNNPNLWSKDFTIVDVKLS